MRKLSLLLTLGASALILVTGCLKDKKFDKQEYGIQIVEVRGVAFPQTLSSPLVYGINSQATPQIVDGPLITLEQDGVAATDVVVTLAINPSLVTAAGLTVLPITAYSINSLSVTIPAGQKFSDVLKITVPNTTSLDPVKSYGIGLTITSVDQGYKIAQNMKDIVIAFNIKNQYDGKYTLRGKFYHPTASPGYYPFTTNVEMQTSGPNSVKMYWPAADDYANPWSTGTALTWFDLQDPEFTVNPTTNAVTVQNVSAGAATFYVMGMGFDNLGYNSRYNPTNKTFYANYGYNSPGGVFNAATSRMWIDTVIYTGPR